MRFSDHEGETKGISLAGCGDSEEGAEDADLKTNPVLHNFNTISLHLSKNTHFPSISGVLWKNFNGC